MNTTSKTILFFGNERLVSGLQETDAPVLRGLIAAGYNIAAVISHHSESLSRKSRPLEVAAIAEEHGIPVLLPNKPSDIFDQIQEYHADAAVLSAYGRIIPQDIIDLFPYGIINIHPSLLPQHRGSTPIESTIINGDSEAGVSIMQLAAAMDAGPVYGQSSFQLQGNETKFELYQKLSQEGASLLLTIFPQILDGSLLPVPQDDAHATYDSMLNKSDAWIDFKTITAIQAERLVRGYLVFPKTKITIFDQDIIITKAHVSPEKNTALDIECSDGSFLSIDELIAPSGKSMQAQAFLNGYAAG